MEKRLLGIIGILILLAVPTVCVSASASSSLHSSMEIYGNTISVTYNVSEPVLIDPSTPGYDATEGTSTINGTTYDTVTVSNNENEQGGVADDNGYVDVSFDISNGKPFCIQIHHTALDLSLLNITISIDGQTKQYSTSWTLTASDQFFGRSNRYSGMNALNNANDWIQSDSVISVQITDSYGFVPEGVILKVVFKPN